MSEPPIVNNTSDLRKLLVDVIGRVRDGTIDVDKAQTIAELSQTILSSAKLDLDYMKVENEFGEPSRPRAISLNEPRTALSAPERRIVGYTCKKCGQDTKGAKPQKCPKCLGSSFEVIREPEVGV